jgi:hypothetical protein
MLQVRIETGIPLPGKIVKREAKLCYKDIPFDDLKVDDSFTLDFTQSQVSSAIGSYRHSSKENCRKEFVTRTEEGKIRVWRVK